MRFSVNAAALPGLAALMDRRSRDLVAGSAYVAQHTQIDWGDAGILNAIWGHHRDIVGAVDDFLGYAASGYATVYATAITKAAAYYRQADAESATRLDACLAPVGDPGKHGDDPVPPDHSLANPRLGEAIFTDRRRPGDLYLPPTDQQADYRYNFTFLDGLSPTSVARELIWQASRIAVALGLLDHPYDLIDEAVRPLSGDWVAFAGCADVFNHLADSLTESGACVLDGVGTIPQVWTGNAADQCANGLARFAGDLTAAVGPLRQLAHTYTTVAEQVRAQAELLASLLTLLIDEVVDKAIEGATGGLAAPFEVINEFSDIVRIIGKMRKVVAAAWHAANTFKDAGALNMADLGILSDGQPLPALTAGRPNLPQLSE